MSSMKFPLLVWKDFAGGYSARTIDGERATAHAETAKQAVEQVKRYLLWLYKQKTWLCEPDFREGQLKRFTVALQPEYRTDQGVYPTPRQLPMQVAAVLGEEEDHTRVCALPLLGIHFHYYQPEFLERLVSDYVQRKLNGEPPQELSRYLLPPELRLEEIFVPVKSRGQKFPEIPVPSLKAVAEPLGERSLRRRFSRAWNRDDEIADLVNRLQAKNNVLLVGESGIGKTAILVDAVRKLERQPSEDLARYRYWSTSASRLIAGMQYLGQWEERCEEVIDDLARIRGVLCIDSALELIRVGGRTPNSSLGAFFAPYLARKEVQMVAECTPAELDACRRLLPELMDTFQIVRIEPFAPHTAREVLDRIASYHAQNWDIELEAGVIDLVFRLHRRFLPYQVFPGRCAVFLRELFEVAGRERESQITTDAVTERFISQTGLPEVFLRDDYPLTREEVLSAFHKQIIGQDTACQTATDVVMTFKAGMNDPQRPLSVLLFTGPTGVGKTETAKAFMRELFGHGEMKNRMVRLDMSEYAGFGAAERLLAQANGEPAEWIRSVRQQPFCVVLFDEVEKAAPQVFDALLGLFDEGRLTDRYGRTTIFRSAVIVMTSNLGAQQKDPLGFDPAVQPGYQRAVTSFFRPEFFNRIDAVVTFQPLDEASIHQITTKELESFAEREGFQRADLQLSWSEGLVDHLARTGYDPRYGARPLQRTIEKDVVAPLSRWLVDHPTVRTQRLVLHWADGLEIRTESL